MKQTKPACWSVVITAAGSSTRMGTGTKKEYHLLQGRPLIQHSLLPFLNTGHFHSIVITVPAGGITEAREALGNLPDSETQILFTEGGATRQESVFNGLNALKYADPDFVLIHDGARPWVTEPLIRSVMEAVETHGAAAPVIPVVDTVKRISSEGFISEHLVRSEITGIQTPQGFGFDDILKAHGTAASDGRNYTDDTEIYHHYRGPVFTVPGEGENKKVTYREDLET